MCVPLDEKKRCREVHAEGLSNRRCVMTRMCCYRVIDMAQAKVIGSLLCVYVLCCYLSKCRTGSVLRLLFKQCSALYTSSAAHTVAVGCWQGSIEPGGVGTNCRQLRKRSKEGPSLKTLNILYFMN